MSNREKRGPHKWEWSRIGMVVEHSMMGQRYYRATEVDHFMDKADRLMRSIRAPAHFLLFEEWAEWEAKTFPQATTLSRLHHLKKEVGELIDAPDDAEEYADAMALLVLAARSQNIDFGNILEAMGKKLLVNRGRKWGEPNEDGFVEHIRNEI